MYVAYEPTQAQLSNTVLALTHSLVNENLLYLTIATNFCRILFAGIAINLSAQN